MPDENAEQQNQGEIGSGPSDAAASDDAPRPGEPVDNEDTPGEAETGPTDAPEVPVAPSVTVEPRLPIAPTERGQRRITRHTSTSTTRTETTTDETIVEDVQTAPPVWAAPAGEHPRPVG